MKTVPNQIKIPCLKDTASDIYQSPEIQSRKQRAIKCI